MARLTAACSTVELDRNNLMGCRLAHRPKEPPERRLQPGLGAPHLVTPTGVEPACNGLKDRPLYTGRVRRDVELHLTNLAGLAGLEPAICSVTRNRGLHLPYRPIWSSHPGSNRNLGLRRAAPSPIGRWPDKLVAPWRVERQFQGS